jgi:AcrR family transcriptional regulator
VNEPKVPRRRSGLQQERSRQTRQRLVRAALELWTERGFETGIEDTTVEEIVRVAGVTKGTFYFHFARKEEILLDMGWETATVVHDEAIRCVKQERSLEESVARMITALAARVRRAPSAAVARSVAEFYRRPKSDWGAGDHIGFAQGFAVVFARAQELGDLPLGIEATEMAMMFQALVMDAILDWTAAHSDLRAALQLRGSILVAGLRESASLRVD